MFDDINLGGYYTSAEVCLNGHIINVPAKNLSQFCHECGKDIIRKCPKCESPIKGNYVDNNEILNSKFFKLPKYCDSCGTPYPWIQSKIDAVESVLKDTKKLNQKEKQEFENYIPDLIINTPKTEIASLKAKNLMEKVGPVLSDMLKNILIDIVLEVVKKTIWG